MKSYPSIPKFTGDSQTLYTFDKIDGSSLRWEFSAKRGWYKFGTRNRMFDQTDPIFGIAVPLFMETLSEPLAKILTDQRWPKAVVFAEFWGENSFAGIHNPNDSKHLTVFDVSPHQKGILPPKDFLKYFEAFGPIYMGQQRWNQEFIEMVRRRDPSLPITFEGVVGKTYIKKQIVMYKAKTQAWIDKVRARYDNDRANEIIES